MKGPTPCVASLRAEKMGASCHPIITWYPQLFICLNENTKKREHNFQTKNNCKQKIWNHFMTLLVAVDLCEKSLFISGEGHRDHCIIV